MGDRRRVGRLRGNRVCSTIRVHIGVATAVWVVDLVKKDARLVKDGLPSYDGLFMIRLSSDGEKVAMPVGETRGYEPVWSPDDKYLAVYTAPRNPEWGGTRSNGYEMWYAENGPFPMGPRISILDQSGTVVKSISLPGKVLGYFEWTQDSTSLLFAAGDNPGPGAYAPEPCRRKVVRPRFSSNQQAPVTR